MPSLRSSYGRLKKHVQRIRSGFRNNDQEFYHRREELERELMGAHISDVNVTAPFLKYTGDKHTCEILEDEFQVNNSLRFRYILQAICIAAFIWFVLYLCFIWADTPHLMTKAFYLLLISALPAIYSLISSRYYTRHPQAIVGGLASIIGLCLLVHKAEIKDFSNMILSLFVIMLFTATPLALVNAAMIAGTVILTYIIAGVMTISLTENATMTVKDMAILGLTNTVAYFFLLYVTYYRELNLRKSVITHHMLLTKASEVENEVDKTHNLLRSMLPDVISEQLRRRQAADKRVRIAEKFGSVTIMFVEVCNFNSISSEQTQDEVLDILNTVYSVFDSVLEDYDAYKVETVGQVYLVVGGCPHRNRRHHEDIGELALEFMSMMSEINQILGTTVPNLRREVQIRIGLNTGSIVAGVVGQRSPRYKLFGDPVNTASRMQSTCPPGRIQCSASTYKALREKFNLEHRGSISVKGKGEMDTYFLICRRDTIDQGRNAIKDVGEMQQHIATNHNVLFRRFSVMENFSTNLLGGSFGPKGGGIKVVPSSQPHVESDTSRIGSSRENDKLSLSSSGDQPTLLVRPKNPGTKSRLSVGRYCRMFCMIFSIGNPEFRDHQFKRGLTNVAKISHILLVVLPVALVVELIIATVWQTSDMATLWGPIIAGTVAVFIICLLLSFMSGTQKYQPLVTLVVELAFFIVTGFIVLINLMGEHPNASFLMVVITIFFNLQLLPMLHRMCCTLLGSFVNCLVLVWAIEVDGNNQYYRYSLEPSEEAIVTMHDILLHFVLLNVSILLQLFSVVIQEQYQFEDFMHNKMIMDQNRILHTQKAQTTSLLSQLLPPSIVPKLVEDNEQHTRIVDRFENVTILFTDMVNFTSFSRRISPLHLMDFLNMMYTRFDAITEKYKLYKVEIIGDAYFVVGGCPVVSSDHTERVVKAAQEMLAVLPELCQVAHQILKAQHEQKKKLLIKEARERQRAEIPGSTTSNGKSSVRRIPTPTDQALAQELECFDENEVIEVPEISIRIGVHVGSVVAGVVGFKDLRYHIFGDAVSLANMMESKGKPSMVHVSQSVIDSLKKTSNLGAFNVEKRKEPIDLSPISPPQHTYFLGFK